VALRFNGETGALSLGIGLHVCSSSSGATPASGFGVSPTTSQKFAAVPRRARIVYHSTLGLIIIKEKKVSGFGVRAFLNLPPERWFRGLISGFRV